MASISASWASDGVQSAAAALALTCPALVAPAITDEQPGWAADHRIAAASANAPGKWHSVRFLPHSPGNARRFGS